MKSVTKPCPICGVDSLSFNHVNQVVNINSKPPTIREVPSIVYVCDEHGWFSLSEQVNGLVTSNNDPAVKQKLASIVKERYVPEQDQPLALKPIESLA
ncbi:TPA: hypothetical protein R4Y95_002328 [Klebsiella variicola subsp. variicola]|jgi:hypothetical protein|uniref:hypothetical protein n=1 Tax=Klebsiella pneumoniae complex TaxID=3390273 RepID=UPI00103518D3|nr:MULTISPECIES: hypothetical protein [Klebsiella]MBA0070026.1 hypothetical protein [Klebsiella pneumoniae]MBZ6547595.1 hypothetical protein [Klebsiella variicola]MBZ6574017.1 hypothetical protein [Klebsiella variicola]MBZ7581759.1 hypothetical protein [Klebsiella variicola]MCP6766221.1 hypothetical protein [Klebsiella pneumoniae]